MVLWITKFLLLLALLVWQSMAFVVVDLPGMIVDLASQIFRGGFLYTAVQFFLRGFHWVGFITGILFLLVIIMNFASFEGPSEQAIMVMVGLTLLFGSTGIGYLPRYFFLEDVAFFPFSKYLKKTDEFLASDD